MKSVFLINKDGGGGKWLGKGGFGWGFQGVKFQNFIGFGVLNYFFELFQLYLIYKQIDE